MVNLNKKCCAKCSLYKSLLNFNKAKRGKFNVTSVCKKCLSERHKITYVSQSKTIDFAPGYKFCPGCNELKELSDFYSKNTGKFGVRNRCKKCDNEDATTRAKLKSQIKANPVSLQKANYKKCAYCLIQKKLNSFLKNRAKCEECRCSRFYRKCYHCLQIKGISSYKKKVIYHNSYVFLILPNKSNSLIKVNSICKDCYKDKIKTCSRCKLTKPLINFRINASGRYNQKCTGCASKKKVSLIKAMPFYQICTGCDVNLPFSSYTKDTSGKFNLKAKCVDCCSAYAKIYRSTEDYKLKKRVSSSNRRARLAEIPNHMPPDWWKILLDFYGDKCMFPGCTKKITKNNPLTHDHVVPLSWPESTHSLENSQILCMSHNTGKLNRSCVDYRDGNICSISYL